MNGDRNHIFFFFNRFPIYFKQTSFFIVYIIYSYTLYGAQYKFHDFFLAHVVKLINPEETRQNIMKFEDLIRIAEMLSIIYF